MLTVKEVARKLNISLGLAYRIIGSGELPSVRIASAIRVMESDLQEYIDGNRSGSQSTTFSHLRL